ASGFGQEQTAGVLTQITDRLSFIDNYLTTDETRSAFRAWIRTLLKPLYTDLGIGALPGDSDNRKELRAVVVNALGGIAHDPEVVAAARTALDRSLLRQQASASAPLEPTAANAIVNVAAQHGDRALFDALLAAIPQTTLPEERNRYMYA